MQVVPEVDHHVIVFETLTIIASVGGSTPPGAALAHERGCHS